MSGTLYLNMWNPMKKPRGKRANAWRLANISRHGIEGKVVGYLDKMGKHVSKAEYMAQSTLSGMKCTVLRHFHPWDDDNCSEGEMTAYMAIYCVKSISTQQAYEWTTIHFHSVRTGYKITPGGRMVIIRETKFFCKKKRRP